MQNFLKLKSVQVPPDSITNMPTSYCSWVSLWRLSKYVTARSNLMWREAMKCACFQKTNISIRRCPQSVGLCVQQSWKQEFSRSGPCLRPFTFSIFSNIFRVFICVFVYLTRHHKYEGCPKSIRLYFFPR